MNVAKMPHFQSLEREINPLFAVKNMYKLNYQAVSLTKLLKIIKVY